MAVDGPEAEEPTDKRFLGAPYDFSRPTAERAKSRIWNPDNPRFFPPKSYGWGWTINFYWVVHPVRWFRQRRH